jgi:hypothetical protein
MLEDSLDPRPLLPLDFARLLASTAAPALSTDDLVRLWNDDASFWTNLRTLEHWIDRARR